MSFIDPRPKISHADMKLKNMDKHRHMSYYVKPSITGYAQAYYRNSITQDENLKMGCVLC